MGYLPNVQLIDITAGTGSDVTAAVKVADGHQGAGGDHGSAEQGECCQ